MQAADDAMQMDVHIVLYPVCTTKKMTCVTATVPKIRFVWTCFFSHSMKIHDLLLSAVVVSLHYLAQMSLTVTCGKTLTPVT